MVKTSFFGVLSAIQCILLYHFISADELQSAYTRGAPSLTFPAFAASVAFLITFRNSFSYERFREGRSSVQTMSASMYTVVAYAISFDNHPNELDKAATTVTGDSSCIENDNDSNSSTRKSKSHLDREKFRYNMVHAMSLLHGVCLQYLRCDWDLDNLSTHDEEVLPAWESASTPGFKIRFWNYFLPRNRIETRKMYHNVSKIQVIGGVSRQERHVLSLGGEFIKPEKVKNSIYGNKGSFSSRKHTNKVQSSHRLWNADNTCPLRGASERPYRLYFSTIELIRRRFEAGGINMPSPVITQIWGTLERSIDAFERCRALSETPFPFPWAQLIIVVLVVWQAVIPFTVIVSFNNQPFGVVMGVAVTWTLWALNEVARDIEDPFTYEPNDIPLARLQYQFNERLLAVASSLEEDCNDFGWHSNDMGMDDGSYNEDKGEEDEEGLAGELPTYKGGLKTSASEGLV